MSKIEKLIDELCPDRVEFMKLGELADHVRGVTYGKKDETQSRDGWKILRSNNISLSSNTLNFDDVKVISKTARVRNNQKLMKYKHLDKANSKELDEKRCEVDCTL